MLSKDTLPCILSRHFNICNKRGLHARASAKFVQTVDNFNAIVEVEKDGKVVGGSSIMGLMMLAASPGCNLTIRVSGPEANDALNALEKLINNKFGEEN
ncbi:Phosphocarrier protein HPr [Candidatus Bartonella washoeensis]|uniref:HPr family phosphocarrier n=2 Tax=Candidatus Bartonella washoeensis TaxID=186739 RepID=J0QHV9_9HYPH|nr:HPr family phosphocarrier protein [Bartonella washoeensis]EJF79290.1 HPr family phosphocarrier [Bartonella washoeensis Sb944nv]EJF85106.1 HPr family phosphocarrier [Bartonella washoeensis 085-0475]SPU26615.1 Phosphocarrier protein HPr [Bartonella washoeensis]